MDKAYNAKVAAARAELKADFMRGAITVHGTIGRPLKTGTACDAVVVEHIDGDELQAFLAMVINSGHPAFAPVALGMVERAAEAYAAEFADARVQEDEAEEDAWRQRAEGAAIDREFHRDYLKAA